MQIIRFIFAICLTVFCASTTSAATYHVGPSGGLASLNQVPWETLKPGDLVLVDWQTNSYKSKWVIARSGTVDAPITVRGIPGPNGELPVIDGNGATTRGQLNYWGDTRGVVKIGGANVPSAWFAKFIVLENLEIRSGRPPYTYTSFDRTVKKYASNAAAIWVEGGINITVRNCILRDNANGLFVSSGDDLASRNILVEGCHIYDNGIGNSGQQHNVYTEAVGVTFQFNWFGPLRTNCLGNNLKDRSAGLAVRYNWIEGGDKNLDLVDASDSVIVRTNPLYATTFVYGNILIKPKKSANSRIVHYGGDMLNTNFYRKGRLYFYNNTVVSYRTNATTALFWLSNNDHQCDCRNNIVYMTSGGASLALLYGGGVLQLSHNWFKPGWKKDLFTSPKLVSDDGTSVMGASPNFLNEAAQDFHLSAASACRNAAMILPAPVLPANDVTSEYVKHQTGETRPLDQNLDIGAYEFWGISSP